MLQFASIIRSTRVYGTQYHRRIPEKYYLPAPQKYQGHHDPAAVFVPSFLGEG